MISLLCYIYRILILAYTVFEFTSLRFPRITKEFRDSAEDEDISASYVAMNSSPEEQDAVEID